MHFHFFCKGNQSVFILFFFSQFILSIKLLFDLIVTEKCVCGTWQTDAVLSTQRCPLYIPLSRFGLLLFLLSSSRCAWPLNSKVVLHVTSQMVVGLTTSRSIYFTIIRSIYFDYKQVNLVRTLFLFRAIVFHGVIFCEPLRQISPAYYNRGFKTEVTLVSLNIRDTFNQPRKSPRWVWCLVYKYMPLKKLL